jgi:hypothetical protein
MARCRRPQPTYVMSAVVLVLDGNKEAPHAQVTGLQKAPGHEVARVRQLP